MAQQVLSYAEELPAIELRFEPIDLITLARAHPAPAYLFPCQASGIDVGAPIYFLDTRPALREWKMIGCERSAQFYRHFYNREPDQVDFCPRNLTQQQPPDLILTKCCLLETTIECRGIARSCRGAQQCDTWSRRWRISPHARPRIRLKQCRNSRWRAIVNTTQKLRGAPPRSRAPRNNYVADY
jgi:hypothetical protein